MVLGAPQRLHPLPLAGSLRVDLAHHRRRADKGDGLDLGRRQERLHRLSGAEPRSLKTMALGSAVSTRGACHNRSSAYEADISARVDRLQAKVERGRITMAGEDFSAVLDSLIWCKFLHKAFQDCYAESVAIYEHITD
jgi:aldehyde:ferredoxin oxidoreductase